ncbi:hypothetical protein OK016_18385 [Vibrio chagasii]|nr:hypothetical protein [Vibrio chagasii]
MTENGTWMAFIGHKCWKEIDTLPLRFGLAANINISSPKFSFQRSTPLAPNEGIELGLKGMEWIQKLQFRIQDSPWLVGLSQSSFSETSIVTHQITPKHKRS